MQLSLLYLIHFLTFLVLTVIVYAVDVAAPAIGCPEGQLGEPIEGAPPEPAEPMIVGIMALARYAYMGCAGLALFVFILIKYYSGSFLPGDFGKLGRVKACGGCCLRMFMQLLTFAHWALLIPNAIFLLTYYTASECYMTKMGTQSFVLFLLPIIWTV